MNEKVNLVSVGSAALSLAVMTLAGCTTDTVVSTNVIDQSLAQQMASDSLYMANTLGRTANELGSAKVNLADDGQFRFVMNRLAAAGKNRDNSPELFERLDKSRSQALTVSKTGPVLNAALRTDWCANRIQLGSENKVGSTITFDGTHPSVSCVGAADSTAYVYADITTFNSNTAGTEAIVVKSGAGEDYSGGASFTDVQISPALPAVVGRVNRTDSLIIAYKNDGTEQVTFNTVTTNLVPTPGSILLAHPIYHPWIANGGYIQMCQLRGAPTQCDYGVGSLTGAVFNGWAPNASGVYTGIAAVRAGTGTPTVPWAGDTANYFAFSGVYVPNDVSHIYLPIQGTVDAGATAAGDCLIDSVDIADFRLIKNDTGGMCTTTSSFKTSFAITPGASRTATFRTIGDFVNNGGVGTCNLGIIINEDVSPALTIRMTARCGGGGPVPRFASLSPEGGDPIPQRIYFLNSCFAEGTPVRLANGKNTTIESLKLGDKVISDTKGTVLTVTGTSHGGEAEPLVELRDDKNHQLRLTSKHPVVKASGDVVFASAIKKDDKVMTDRGIATITSATRVAYNGQVYNLKLGTAEEQAKVGKDGTTLFAGGFLVGDSAMQDNYTKRSREVATREVSSAWARDWANGVHNPSMKRILK
jgi:hypothetical protein